MNQFNIPILFITFKREDYARKVFERIKMIKPKKFYFYSDRPNKDQLEDIKNNETIRNFVNEINWDCELHKFFRVENGGMKKFHEAIDWVFNKENHAIILEDDCVPSLAFFSFCEQLLPLYENDPRIWLISGNNFLGEKVKYKADYVFTKYPYQWGWATWRDRWKSVKFDNIDWSESKVEKIYKHFFINRNELNYTLSIDNKVINNSMKNITWDYFFGISRKINFGFGIIPTHNLVSNIGIMGLHNQIEDSSFHNLTTTTETSYIIKNHPTFIFPDYNYDHVFFKKVYNRNTFLKKVKRKINKTFKKYLWRNFNNKKVEV